MAEDDQVQGEPEEQTVSVELPMLQIPLEGADINVSRLRDGRKALVLGPVAVTFVLPLEDDGRRELARRLGDGISIARALPRRRGRGR